MTSDYLKVLILLLTAAPTLIESYFDRFGETKKEKVKDTLWLVMAVIVSLGLAYWLFDINPVGPALLILMFRFTTFDYLAHFLLKRYSEGHKNINIWKFTGTVAYFDKLTAKVDWRIRILIRILVLLLAVWWYLSV